jgi:tetratricopeptide (TPR) repeat protein
MRMAVLLVALLFLLSLAAGFSRGKDWSQATTESAAIESVTEEQRAAARVLLERAVQARHAELNDEALRLAVEARNIDPDVPGAALLAAEMALSQGDTEIAVAAAKEALEQAQYAADALLILALNAWRMRGQSGVDAADAASTQLLTGAADAELSNGAVRFFAGDLQRAIGRPDEAHRSLLGGLYRQEPWQSAALLTAKLALSIDQAGGAGSAALLDVGEEAEVFGASATALGRAQRESVDRARSAVCGIFTHKHLEILARDPLLTAALVRDQKKPPFLPFGEISVPAIEDKPD